MTQEQFVKLCVLMGDLRPAEKIAADWPKLSKARKKEFLERGHLLDEQVYCTSFCNKGHSMDNGEPIDHECYVLTVRGLRAERDGDYTYQPFRTNRVHQGRPAKLGPRPEGAN